MWLEMDTTPKYLNCLEVAALLHLVTTKVAHDNHPDTPVAKRTWIRDPSKPSGPWFAIAPSLLLRKLLWRDVLHIVEALKQFYQGQPCKELAFLIHDSKRGALGSGTVWAGGEKTDNQPGADNDHTATS